MYLATEWFNTHDVFSFSNLSQISVKPKLITTRRWLICPNSLHLRFRTRCWYFIQKFCNDCFRWQVSTCEKVVIEKSLERHRKHANTHFFDSNQKIWFFNTNCKWISKFIGVRKFFHRLKQWGRLQFSQRAAGHTSLK